MPSVGFDPTIPITSLQVITAKILQPRKTTTQCQLRDCSTFITEYDLNYYWGPVRGIPQGNLVQRDGGS